MTELILSELAERSPHCLINQFPGEQSLTVKDLLAAAVRIGNRYLYMSARHDLTFSGWSKKADSTGMYPSWFPITYNLHTELPHFISHFQHRDDR